MFGGLLSTLKGAMDKVHKFLITIFIKLNETIVCKLTFNEYLHAFNTFKL
jgi:hypothetical protein